jgi:hypothetical protein
MDKIGKKASLWIFTKISPRYMRLNITACFDGEYAETRNPKKPCANPFA